MRNRISNWFSRLKTKIKSNNFGPGKWTAIVAIGLTVVLLIGVSIAWFTSQINLTGSEFSTGTIEFIAYGYDANGSLVTTIYPEGKIPEGVTNANAPLFSDTDMCAGSVSTAYIAIENTGTLDMEYKLSFSVSEHLNTAKDDMIYLGGYWYSLVDITNQVTGSLESYAVANKAVACTEDNCPGDAHTCSEKNSSHNLSTISQYSGGGKINANSDVLHYYRLDYGVRRDATPADYAGRKFAVNANVFTSQVGTIQDPDGGYGVTHYVTDVTTLETAINAALPGDTILLMNNVTYNGDLIIKKCINFEAGGKTLTVNGNMIYDFVSTLPLKINLQGKGTIKVLSNGAVGGNFTISAPKSQVELIGGNSAGDLLVGRYFTVDATNSAESGGCIFSDIVIMDGDGKDAMAVYVRSNTKITVSSGVTLERIEAAVQATNIEIQNAGLINEIMLSNMFLTTQVDAPQIYIHNYNRIFNIILPSWSAPFKANADGSYSGNTRIVVSAGGVIDNLTASDYFTKNDIEDEGSDIYVEQIVLGVDTGLKVYYRDLPDKTATIEMLLSDYFTNKGMSGTRHTDALEAIDTIEVICRGDKLVTPADFTYMRTKLKGLASVNLSQASLENNTLPEGAFLNKSLLTKLELPRSVAVLKKDALSGTSIHSITVPATVTSIESNALRYIPYVYMQSYEPCTIIASNISGHTYFFVPESVLSTYKATGNWAGFSTNIYPMAQMADDGVTHVRKLSDGTYEIVHYLGTATAFKIGEDVSLNGTKITVTQVGEYAYYHISQSFTLSFDDSVVRISDFAFFRTDVKGDVVFNKVEYIGEGAFEECEQLLTISENNSIKHIGVEAFQKCLRLYQVSLPNIETVDESAFANNGCLVSVAFGENLKSLAKTQFSNAQKLREVIIQTPNASNLSVTGFYTNISTAVRATLRVYVPANAIDDYRGIFGNNVCEYGEKYGTYNIEVVYNNTVIGTMDLGMFRIRDIDADSVSISSCNVYAADVSDAGFWSDFVAIPETIGNKNVVRIGPSAYKGVTFSNITLATNSTANPWGNNNATFPTSVKEVAAYAFYGTDISVTSLGGITTLGDNAFDSCTKLYYLDAPNLLTIGETAFLNVKSLYQLKAEQLHTVGVSAFNGCSALMRLYVPVLTTTASSWLNGTTQLCELWIDINGTAAPANLPAYSANTKMLVFTNRTNASQKHCIASSALPASISDYSINDDGGNTLCVLEDFASYWVTEGANGVTILNYVPKQAVTSSYTIPGTLQVTKNGTATQMKVIALGYASFKGVDFNGNDVKFSSNITTLANRVFSGNTTLGSTLHLNSVTSIGQYAFDATPITRVIAPNLTTSGVYAFANCTLLKSANMPRLTQLSGNIFRSCSALESIYLEDVTAIVSNALYQNSKLTNITINRVITGTVPSFAAQTGLSSSLAFYVPSQSAALYRASSSYSKYKIYALDTVMSNSDGVYSMVEVNGGWEIISFLPSIDVVTLNIPESYNSKNIVTIRPGAFAGCNSITTIVLPATFNCYQQGAFDDAISLQNINVASGSTYFSGVNGVLFSANGDELVYYPVNKTATSYTIPSGTVVIQSYAFGGALLLNNVTVPSSVTVVGYKAFDGVGLESITFNGTTPPYVIGTDIFDTSIDGFAIRVPTGYGDAYKGSSGFVKYQSFVVEQ